MLDGNAEEEEKLEAPSERRRRVESLGRARMLR
jgi:hypothetical protein